MNFFIFWPSKICVNPIDVVSSLSLPWCQPSSGRCPDAIVSCHASFPWRQDKLAASASSSGNASSHHLLFRAEIKALNLHHCRRPPSLNNPTPIIHCYKKVISTLAILSTTQPHQKFSSSLARASRHRSSSHCCHSLSPPSHAHRPSTQ
jgi:hypothetical protein